MPPTRKNLGGDFGPEKKYLAPPPPKTTPQTPSQPLASPSSPAWEDPPPPRGIFNKESSPPSPGASDSPFPCPQSRKNKKYPKRPPRNLKLTLGQGCLSLPQGRFSENSFHSPLPKGAFRMLKIVWRANSLRREKMLRQ